MLSYVLVLNSTQWNVSYFWIFVYWKENEMTTFKFFFVYLDRHHLNQSMTNKVNDRIHVKFVQDEKLKNNDINLLRNYLFSIQIIKRQLIISMYSYLKRKAHCFILNFCLGHNKRNILIKWWFHKKIIRKSISLVWSLDHVVIHWKP